MNAALNNDIRIFTGNSAPELAHKICDHLSLPLGQAMVSTFSDGEIRVEIADNVRGRDVFLIQSTCPPTNHNLMELLIMIDAVKRASARRITAVIPYFGYARQDRKVAPRVPITAKLVADLLSTAGAQRVLTMDLHVGQIQGFFDIPVDNLYASPIMIPYIRENFQNDLAIVSPDAGGVPRARAYAKRLDATLGLIDKRRDAPGKAKAMNLIGEVTGQGSGHPGRYHRHRRHLERGLRGYRQKWRPQCQRLLHPCRALRAGGGPDRQLPAAPPGGHRHHSPERGGQKLPQDRATVGGAALGPDHRAHPPGRLHQLAV